MNGLLGIVVTVGAKLMNSERAGSVVWLLAETKLLVDEIIIDKLKVEGAALLIESV